MRRPILRFRWVNVTTMMAESAAENWEEVRRMQGIFELLG